MLCTAGEQLCMQLFCQWCPLVQTHVCFVAARSPFVSADNINETGTAVLNML